MAAEQRRPWSRLTDVRVAAGDVAGLLRPSTTLCALSDLHALLAAAAAASGPQRPAGRKRGRARGHATQSPAAGPGSGAAHSAHAPALSEPTAEGGPFPVGCSSAQQGSRDRRAHRALALAERKAWFMLVWAAEQPEEVFHALRVQAEREGAAHAHVPALQLDAEAAAVLPLHAGRQAAPRIQEL